MGRTKTSSSALKLELDNLMNKLRKTVILKNNYYPKTLHNNFHFFVIFRTRILSVAFNQIMKSKVVVLTKC